MRQAPARWPVISFLELFCCALGGAAILLILINREVRSNTETTRMLRVTARVQLPGEGEPSLELVRDRGGGEDTVRVSAQGNSGASDSGLWGSGEVHRGASGRSLFFVCDARGRTGTYTLRVSQEGVLNLPPDRVPDLRALREMLTAARAAVNSDRSMAALGRVVQLLSDWAITGQVDNRDLRSAWYTAFGQAGPTEASPREYLRLLGSVRVGRVAGRVCKQYALTHLLLLAADGGAARDPKAVKLRPQDLAAYSRSDRDTLALLWRDLMAYLSLRLGSSRDRVSFELDGVQGRLPGPEEWPSVRYGHYYSDEPILPAIGSMKEAAEAFSRLDREDWNLLDPLWLEAAEVLCRPRDLYLWIDWGSIRREVKLGGELLHPRSSGSRTTYELSIRLTADDVTVEAAR